MHIIYLTRFVPEIASLVKFQGKRNFPLSVLPHISCKKLQLTPWPGPLFTFGSLGTCAQVLSNTFLVKVGPGGGRIETNLPFLIYLPVTDLHIGIISIGFIDRNWIRKLRSEKITQNSKS